MICVKVTLHNEFGAPIGETLAPIQATEYASYNKTLNVGRDIFVWDNNYGQYRIAVQFTAFSREVARVLGY